MTVRIAVEDAPDEATQNVVLEGLTNFNAANVGQPTMAPVWVVARGEDGAVVGGAQGVVWFQWLYLHVLWVDERARGTGVGSRLLRLAEQAAADKGCTDSFLYTFSFQAPDFYRRQGYEVFGELDRFPGETRQYWMRKSLAATARDAS